MKYFNLFSTVMVTKGAGRILISDLQRNTSELYPLEVYELIVELKIHPIEELLRNYDEESREIVKEYLEMFLEKEYGFITDNDWDHNFPVMSYAYNDPCTISNVFIELNDLTILQKIRTSIDSLGVQHLVIFSEKELSSDDFLTIDHLFDNTSLENIEIYSPFHQKVDLPFIQALHKKTERIYNLIFYNCSQPPFKAKNEYRFTLHFVEEDLKISACGKVELKYFNTNLSKVLEAVNYNSCLYKKIGIDKKGNIKNCPLMAESFGNIHINSLEDALNNPAFTQYWNLTKDHIEECKDCEFRYLCTDCRAYTERSAENRNSLDVSKPLKCGYNPYSGKWEEWSTNPLKQQAIQYYDLSKSKHR
ncbi:grasp-with-spasm system SPASM domain peptide maturase [Chryseobacterium pennipullorum]|uniref:Grasp-with-spasm system SPASM domain peptide maturase n=1 Tax=Chryseobacterium pennipullorum TaxID=2258963 RepID=A0A3D9AZG5_9FLAO|nr:grasp-with-spasm system SPASM domain peptide maturase [Chryseobacterium pennipullorum]REC46740.1 grasp-with-spasm system SPASM domain peptide maturase [Chryseobacterium pennipullorum]